MLQDITLLSDILRRNIYIDRCQILNIFWMIRCLASTSFIYTIDLTLLWGLVQMTSVLREEGVSQFLTKGREVA